MVCNGFHTNWRTHRRPTSTCGALILTQLGHCQLAIDAFSDEFDPQRFKDGLAHELAFREAALRQMAADGIERVVVFTQYPQWSCTTTGSSLTDLADALGMWPPWAGRTRFDWFVVLPDEEDVRAFEPDLAAIVGELRGDFLQASVEGLRRVGVAHPEDVAPGLLMAVDGLLMSQVADTGHPLSPAQCKALLSRVIQSGLA